eukprot:scaffold35051_cov65-Phaeocystis_antarctica.AAC.6
MGRHRVGSELRFRLGYALLQHGALDEARRAQRVHVLPPLLRCGRLPEPARSLARANRARRTLAADVERLHARLRTDQRKPERRAAAARCQQPRRAAGRHQHRGTRRGGCERVAPRRQPDQCADPSRPWPLARAGSAAGRATLQGLLLRRRFLVAGRPDHRQLWKRRRLTHALRPRARLGGLRRLSVPQGRQPHAPPAVGAGVYFRVHCHCPPSQNHLEDPPPRAATVYPKAIALV